MRHAQFKNGTGRICTANGIHHQHKEPQGYEMRICTICRAVFPESKSESHVATCQGSSLSLIKEAASVRPDKWIELKTEKGNSYMEVVIDVSIVAGTTATNINSEQSIDDGLKERERKKHALYGDAAKERGEKLMVIAITPNGTMCDDAKLFAKLVAKTSDALGTYTEHHAARDLKREVLKANACSLINGEKAMKAYYSRSDVRDLEELTAAYLREVSDADEPEWYEFPEDAHRYHDASRRASRQSSFRDVGCETPLSFRSCADEDVSEFPPEETVPTPPVVHPRPSRPLPSHRAAPAESPVDAPHSVSLSNSFNVQQNPSQNYTPPLSAEPWLQYRLSSFPDQPSAPPSPMDVSFSAEPGRILSAKDSQKTQRWSSPSDIPCLGPAQPPKGLRK